MNGRTHREVYHLRDKYGKQIPFYKNNQPIPYDLLTEMEVGGNRYAVLRSPQTGEDAFIYKVKQADNSYQFEPLDDTEWETVVDAYDEWLYYQERQ